MKVKFLSTTKIPKFLTFLTLFIFNTSVFSQDTYVPDDVFEAYLEAGGRGDGIDNNNNVLTANVETITVLNLISFGITDFTGIEDFAALQVLNCYNNGTTILDVSNNTALVELKCAFNSLTTLDVSQNTALTYLDCQANQLTSLDVSKNTLLTYLNFPGNQLTNINLNQNTDLEYLICGYNLLETLDVSQNLSLIEMACNNNNLTALDVTGNANLNRLFTRYNQISNLNFNSDLEYLDVRINQLTELDVSQNTAMYYVKCETNLLENLNVKNGNNTNFTQFTASSNPNLTCITVDDVAYSTTNWTIIDSGVSFSTDCSTFSTDEFNLNSISIYPNPSKDIFEIDLNKNANYKLFNIQGQEVLRGSFIQGLNNLNTRSLSSGIYVLNLESDIGIVSKKLVKN